MNRTIRNASLFGMLVGLATASPVRAWSDELALDERAPALAGRWTIEVPTGTRHGAPASSPMGPAPDASQDDAFLIADGLDGLEIRLHRGIHRAPTDPLEGVGRVVRCGTAESTRELVTLADGAWAVLVSCPADDVLPARLAAFLGHPDGWVDVAEMRVARLGENGMPTHERPAANALEAPEPVRLARAVVSTLVPGTPSAPPSAVTRSLRDVCDGRLVIDVPEGFIFRERGGPDFALYDVVEAVTLGDTASHVGIYVGGRPSPVRDTAPASIVPGPLLGTTVCWREHVPGADGQLMREAMAQVGVSCDPPPPNETTEEREAREVAALIRGGGIHVWTGDDGNDAERLAAIVATLRVEDVEPRQFRVEGNPGACGGSEVAAEPEAPRGPRGPWPIVIAFALVLLGGSIAAWLQARNVQR